VAGVEWERQRSGAADAMRCGRVRERERNELGFGEGRGAPARLRLICGRRRAASNGREAPRRIQRPEGGRAGVGCWWADSRPCRLGLLSGRYRAANFRAVLRAGPPCWGCSPSTKRTSGRAGTKPY
jgi:hypothetical protein